MLGIKPLLYDGKDVFRVDAEAAFFDVFGGFGSLFGLFLFVLA